MVVGLDLGNPTGASSPFVQLGSVRVRDKLTCAGGVYLFGRILIESPLFQLLYPVLVGVVHFLLPLSRFSPSVNCWHDLRSRTSPSIYLEKHFASGAEFSSSSSSLLSSLLLVSTSSFRVHEIVKYCVYFGGDTGTDCTR